MKTRFQTSWGELSGAVFLVLVAVALVSTGCSEEVKVTDAAGHHSIVDNDGKIWDITTAVNKYGMHKGGWEFGLGKNAIQPLIEPPLASPGSSEYPRDDATFLVIGVSVGDDVRAYGKLDLQRNEVVDVTMNDTPLAVTY